MKVSMLRGLNMPLLLWLFSLCFSARTPSAENGKVSVDIGVIYDEDGNLGKMGYECIKVALSEFYKAHGDYKTRIALHTELYNRNDGVVGAASAALNLLKYKKVKAIVGPTTSKDAEFVIHLGEKAEVPILSYSATNNPCVSSGQCSYFLSVAQNDASQVKAITAIIKKFKWKDVVFIYVDDNEYGVGLIPYLDDALWQINARIPFHEAILSTATDDQIRQLLKKLKSKQTRIFVVHLSPELASRLFLLANELEMMGQGYVWITTTSVSNELLLGSLDESVIESMQGVVGVQTYVPQTNELKRFRRRWEREFPDIKVNVMGLWAYDAACALARAVEQSSVPNSSFKKTKMPGKLSSILDGVEVSRLGPELVKALYNTSFNGLAGNFSLANGQQGSSSSSSSSYKIINVLGSGSYDVGVWTSENKGMLATNINSRRGKNSVSNPELRTIIWPGDVTSPPKGWEIPASGNRLKVGVPVKPSYEQLVKVTQIRGRNGTPNSINATGFCIEIFEAVMKNLGYSDHYDYFASNETYDELVHQVFLEKYDVVVGDITIIANRSSYVDFTLPFTESGVTMVVPVRDDKQSAWVFLKPLTWELWVATLCFFVFIAFAIWVLEHRINDEFRGPPLQQAGTSLFYSFSMMVFAQRENVFSNLSRCVVVVWVFVVLVLTQSYTASLTSMLTVQQLKPAVTGIDELLQSRERVGVQNGTFVRKFLIQKGFYDTQIISYSTCEDLDYLLSNGSQNGGIAAVFDEIPYMKLFLEKRSSKYIMLQPISKTDGFGFAFPKGSPLVSEVSGEILKVTEGEKMSVFERKWGMQLYNDSDQGNAPSSTSLSVHSFLGLFLIAGIATGLSLLIFTVQFLYENRDICYYSDASVWSKIRRLAKAFEDPDITAHTYKKKLAQNTQNAETDQTSIHGDGSTASITPPRPSNYTETTEDRLPFSAGVSPSRLQLDSELSTDHLYSELHMH